MLEKIGLPSKPSQRGNNWVVDASHCQGCSSQFTFINRKHHCRRCGGLFCNSCTQQRMLLRGQGDSPVRICDPCKQLEEAARFERRHGQKGRAGRGDSKVTSTNEDDLLNQILGNHGKDSLSSKRESISTTASNMLRATSSASSSSMQEVSAKDEGEDLLRSLSNNEPNALKEMESTSPEELRQQALDEKKKHRTLKAEGKSEEALKAFKRGKELERQAVALEIYLRKNRKKALSSKNITEVQKSKDDSKESDIKINRVSQSSKGKDDLAAELRELGWSDMDLHEADKKPTNVSLEGELSTLIREFSQNSDKSKGPHAIDKTEVIAIKKKALGLKREGKLAEAKEELKRAKILEKQLEEQELLAEADESDDELSLLIHSMDNDKQDDLLIADERDPGFDFNHLMGFDDNLGVDSNFEVTDADFNDPEMAAALKSFGWDEDLDRPENVVTHSAAIDKSMLLSEIKSLKKEALSKKRAGNTSEAMELLKKAKLLEKDLDGNHPQEANMNIPAEEPSRSSKAIEEVEHKSLFKSKITIQRELLGLKKKALALRREGRLDESEEELKKAKILEQQLDEMGTSSQVKVAQVHVTSKQPDISGAMDLDDKGEEEDVTENDMNDPTYLSLLSNLGWKDEDAERISLPVKPSLQNNSDPLPTTDSPSISATSSIRAGVSRRSKGEIQRELLGLKRKALALRRQGQTEEAEEVLRKTKELEDQIAELEAPKKEISVEVDKQKENENMKSSLKIEFEERSNEDSRKELHSARLLEKSREVEKQKPNSGPSVVTYSTNVSTVAQKEQNSSDFAPKPLSSRDRFKLQQESLAHKRLALKLRREGRTEEAEAEFQLAKALETQLEESASHCSVKSAGSGANPADDAGVEDLLDPQLLSALKSVGIADANAVSQASERPEPSKTSIIKNEISSLERIQLEEQIKAEKVKAVTLKRAGKKAEALDALRQAKMLEKKLNSLPSH